MTGLLALLLSLAGMAQTNSSDTVLYKQFDTVTISALGKQAIRNIPYSIQRINIALLEKTPRTQLMNQLAQQPAVSIINGGNGINKPVIRGLSFNHIQLFANGTRLDNQTWDDNHDIGIAENGFDKVEIISGPAALIYGPNAMGGAMIFSQSPPAREEKFGGMVQLGLFTNSIGANFKTAIQGSKKDFYYSASAAYQMHTNYLQPKRSTDTAKPLAFNSKFTNIAFKGTVGIRKQKRQHQLSYNLYQQLLGIIEDEALEALNNPAKKEERDYEMEAPYQNIQTHIVSLENSFQTGNNSELVFNGGFQFNGRKEYEPGPLPKSKYLGVGLDLKTFSGDLQWTVGKTKASGLTIGLQDFYQDNKNTGSLIRVPDAHINTLGIFVVAHHNTKKFNFLAGLRADAHRLQMFKNISPTPDTLNAPFPKPAQELTKNYLPFSFSAGLVYHSSDQLSFKWNLASGYTAPNYAQLTTFGVHEGTFRFEIGDNNLKMEKNIEADISGQWADPNVSVLLNFYSNFINNYIYIDPTPDTVKKFQVFRWRQNDAIINGAELDINIHPPKSWFEGYFRSGLIRGKLRHSEGDLPYIPANKFIAGLGWKQRNQGKWRNAYATLQFSLYNSQDKVAAFEKPTDGYFLTDVFIGVMPPMGKDHHWQWALFCTNIFNQSYFNHLSLIKQIGVREPGRNFGLQFRYKL